MKIESKLGVNQYIFSEEELQLIDDALSDAMKEMNAYGGYNKLEDYKDTKTYFEKYSNLLNEIRSKR